MKKIYFIVVLAMFTFISCEKETLVPAHDLPLEIKTFIATHFPSNNIIQSVKDRDGLGLTYEIMLDGNISLEFNLKKEIIDIDGIAKLPDSVIPSKILSYVSTNYPGNVITDWEIEGSNQQVELDNGLELEFNMKGDFLRIDD